MPTNPAPAFEFCQYVHDDGRRCVSGYAHGGNHSVQPQSSVTVQSINRREKILQRLGDEQPPVTGPGLIEHIDRAVADPMMGSVPEADADVAAQRMNAEAALGSVPQTASAPSQATHTLVDDTRLGNRAQNRYCERCGAQVEGPGAWGHDSNCPKLIEADAAPVVDPALVAEAEAGYDLKDITPIPVVRDKQEAPVTESNDQIAVEAPQNEPTPPVTATQPTDTEFVATQVDDEDPQVAEVERPLTEDDSKA